MVTKEPDVFNLYRKYSHQDLVFFGFALRCYGPRCRQISHHSSSSKIPRTCNSRRVDSFVIFGWVFSTLCSLIISSTPIACAVFTASCVICVTAFFTTSAATRTERRNDRKSCKGKKITTYSRYIFMQPEQVLVLQEAHF